MMSEKKIFIVSGIIFTIILLLLIILFAFSYIEKTLFSSILWAAILVSLNFAAGFLAIRWGINKPNEIFLLTIFGGMILRMMVMAGLVIISLKFLKLYPFSYILAVLFFYIYFLIVEIIYLNFRKK